MAILNESGITIDTSDHLTFQLENGKCNRYSKLAGMGSFKTIDIGWYNLEENTLYLIELKDFTKVDKKDILEKWRNELFKKTLDCFLLFIAMKKPTKYVEENFYNCSNDDLSNLIRSIQSIENIKMKFFHIIYIEKNIEMMLPLRDSIVKDLAPYQSLKDN